MMYKLPPFQRLISFFADYNTPFRARLLRGTFFFLIASSGSQFLGMAGAVLCARILNPDLFGQLNMIRSTLLMFGALGGTGLGMAAVKFVAELRDVNLKQTGSYIGYLIQLGAILGGFGTFLCLFIAHPVAVYILDSKSITQSVMIGSLALFFNTLSGIQIGVLTGFENYKKVAQLTLIDAILNFTLITSFAWVWGLNGALVGSVLVAMIGFPLKHYSVLKACGLARVQISYKFKLVDMASILKFAFPAVLVGLSAQPFDWLVRLIFVRNPDGYLQLGLFSVAVAWSQIVLFLPGQLAAPTQAVIPNLLSIRDTQKIKNLLLKMGCIIFCFSSLIAAIVFLMSTKITSLYGPEYIGAANAIGILAFSSIFCAASQTLKNFLYALNKPWIVVHSHLVMGGILCSVGWLLRDYGVEGLSFAYVVGWLSLLIFQLAAAIIALKKF